MVSQRVRANGEGSDGAGEAGNRQPRIDTDETRIGKREGREPRRTFKEEYE
jgi:hypothetical protein